MTLSNERLQALVEDEEPIDVVWEALWDIWSPSASTPEEHYSNEREWASVELERGLIDIYWELYSEEIPWKCVNEASMEVPDGGAFVVMDAMSVREAALFVPELEDRGYDVDVDYSFATVPSETTPYKERVGYKEIEKAHKSASVKDRSPSLSGDESVVWSRYPDALLENIQEGKTEISTIQEAYEDTVEVLISILDQLESERVIIGSDHGYVREESGFNFGIGDVHKNRLQDVFGSDRFVSIEDVDGGDLVEDKIAVEADGYYMVVGQYTTPSPGKYSVYQHGGMSLMECLTPRIEIQR